MSLFQNTVVKKYSNTLNKPVLEEKWLLFTTLFHNTTKQINIRNSKEEQYQAIFLNDLFVQVLGYTQHPSTDYNLITEQKNETNSKKADGAIILNENVHAVIELKGTETTDLTKIETQAFGYKNNHKDCGYVIISNFEKLRFYVDNATEFIEFNLFTLSRDEFNLLYLCLSLESMQTDLPKKIKYESVSNEDKITKELYKDYSAFRKELFTDIVQLNPQYNQLELFKKTQKLLDRFLFIFFAEDRQLLPTNLIFSINLEWQKLREARIPVSLYDRYKMYFQDLNTGARVSLPAFGKHTNEIVTAQYDIYAYNGGLFQPDDLLDNITINDDLLFKHTKKLSDYDFESEVDVNILGHIFENSLNEIDEITNTIEGQEIDKTKTKRKKDGVFYTPKHITKYIVDNTIGKLCEEKKVEIGLDLTIIDKTFLLKTNKLSSKGKNYNDKIKTYRDWLLDLKICDPACGSGAFLNEAIEFLINEHNLLEEHVIKIQRLMTGDENQFSSGIRDISDLILEKNIYGVDLNEESVEIAKLSLWLRTAQRNRKLNSLNHNIKCGNSLIDDAAISGDKAFNWQNEFPQVFETGGFDIVIGNPPYVQSHSLDEKSKNYIYKNYLTAEYQINTYAVFTEKIIKIIKESGIYSIIIPNYWLSTKYDSKLRTFVFLSNHCIEMVNIFKVFEDATVDTLILTGKKDNLVKFPKKTNIFSIDKSLDNIDKRLSALSGRMWSYSEIMEFKNIHEELNLSFDVKLNLRGNYVIGNFLEGFQGMKPYEMGKGLPEQTREMMNERIYNSAFKVDESYFPLIGAGNVQRYTLKVDNSFIKYGKNLAAPRRFEIFVKPRIILNRIFSKKTIDATFVEDIIINNTDVFNLIPKNDSFKIYLKPILAILTTKVCSTYFKNSNINLNRNAFPKLNVNNILEFPLPDTLNNETLNYLSKKADLMLLKNKELQEVSSKFSKYFSGQFKIEKLSGKLEKWYVLSFDEFIKEINKAIKIQKGTPLTKKDEFDWIDLFEENKAKANKLQNEIAVTDKAIDAMVYELYGLSEVEIGIVEGS